MSGRLPPPSPTSIPSAFFSLLVHAGVVVAGLMTIPYEHLDSESTPMIYIPVELVSISDSTNLTAVQEVAEKSDENLEATVEAQAMPAPSLPPPEEDTISFDPPKEKPKEEPKKVEAKPAPPQPAKSFNSELDDILASVTKEDARQSRTAANPAPASSSTEAPRLSAGDRRRMTASIADVIRSQLISKGCFADHSDMADARRLKATFRVWFGRNGKFSQRYQLVAPAREPFNDPPMQAFIAHARRALDMCNNLGWQVPEEYFQLPQPQYIDLDFVPKIGASQ